MKIKKLTSSTKSRFGIKDLRVNLTRLNKETLHRFMGLTKPIVNYNLSMRMRNGEVSHVHDSGTDVRMLIMITSIRRLDQPRDQPMSNNSQKNTYSFRNRVPHVHVEKPKKIAITTVAVVSNPVRSRQLWAFCKKLVLKEKLVEGAIVFAKQVYFVFIVFTSKKSKS